MYVQHSALLILAYADVMLGQCCMTKCSDIAAILCINVVVKN
jgi:hypothetical protein